MVPKIVIGLGFGDEGKGMAVAHEVEKAIKEGLEPVVVRFNGGPQAAHNVRVVRNGQVLHHTHSQFGSGAMLGADTVLTSGMLFDPLGFIEEAEHLSLLMGKDITNTVTVSSLCPVVTPIHIHACRIIETKRGDARHGSTGYGIGVARMCEEHAHKHGDNSAIVTVGTLRNGTLEICAKLKESVYLIERLCHVCIDLDLETLWSYAGMLRDAFVAACENGLHVCDEDYIDFDENAIIFEGSQGMLLDKKVGWFPHVTYGDMDAFEARRMCGEAKVIGVTRSYQTRHGAGPMPTEGTFDAQEEDNGTYEWAGEFRTGLLDIPSLARAAEATCVDEIAVSHFEMYPGRCVTGWQGTSRVKGIDRYVPCDMVIEEMDRKQFISEIEDACHATVTVIGTGPTLRYWRDI